MFKLLRYFSLTSAAAFLTVSAILVVLYRQTAIEDLRAAAQSQNVALGMGLINAVWPTYAGYLGSVEGLDGDRLRARPETAALSQRITALTAGLPVVRVKIYDLAGTTLFSTERQQIGEPYGVNKEGFVSAVRKRVPATEIGTRPWSSELTGEVRDQVIVETYIPVHTDEGATASVFEIYSDVTPLIELVDATATRVFAGLIAGFAALYGLLYSIVRHADRIVKRQYSALLRSEEVVRSARDELEIRVGERTADLAAANERLVAENNERRTAENALLLAKSEAERANQVKSKFLAAASHDLRQPLQTLMLSTALLARRVSDTELRGVVKVMQETQHGINGMLRALLDLARLEAPDIRPEIVEFPVDALVARIVNDFDPQAREKGMTLRTVPSTAVVASNPALLESIVRNFVANAIVHADRGAVLVGCRRRGDRVRIEVWDSGPGIPGDKLESIFEEFVQLDAGSPRLSRGMGLGLAIVDRTARILGHRIEVASRVGKGSMFAVDVPRGASRASDAREPTPDAAELTTACVVAIDDEPDVLASLERLLEDRGFAVLAETSVEGALARLAGSPVRPDLVIADLHLAGDVSGIDAVARVRRYLGYEIPALLITGDTSPERLRKMHGSGLQLLHKPVAAEELVAAARRALAATRREPATT
jgi:signal transduction histidine kinase/CheY-like chemotaxis protein